MTSVLRVRNLEARYGHVRVLRGIDLDVEEGEIVLILGANGAGKTTTLRALTGLVPTKGEINVLGRQGTASLYERSRQGVAYLPEERGIIRTLSVADNLRAARVSLSAAFEISPELREIQHRSAGLLSGGEQQILALTRAIVSEPKVILADELSLGLAPLIVQRMLRLVELAAARGAGVLMVEQFVHQALDVAHRGYVLQQGEVVLEGEVSRLREEMSSIEQSYLGMSEDVRETSGKEVV